MKEAGTKQGDTILPTFIEEKEGMGEVKNFIKDDKEKMEELELEDTDLVIEEEE